jgi:formyl-CoA transferase
LANADRLDSKLREWASRHTLDECMSAAKDAGVVASPILTVADIMTDETYDERGLVVSVEDAQLGEVKMQAVVPFLSEHPGGIWRAGPTLGQDNDVVFREYLGLADGEYGELKTLGVI